MANTITGYAKSVFLKLRAVAGKANRRPKTVGISLVIALLYLPILHFGHSYSGSFRHFFKDTLMVRFLIQVNEWVESDAFAWILFGAITLSLIYLFFKISKKENLELKNDNDKLK